MSRILVFDVNETLLDLSALDAPFQQVFGHTAVRKEWFAQLLHSALVSTVTGPYTDFSTIGRAALQMVAAQRGVQLSAEDGAMIFDAMRHLPPHPEVIDSLDRLREAGYRLVALSNGAPDVLHDQLAHAELAPFFEKILSADAVQRLKPAPEPYHYAAQTLGVAIHDICMVAAHAWDAGGAMRAGTSAAFVARPGKALDPLLPSPEIVGPHLRSIAEQIIEAEDLTE